MNFSDYELIVFDVDGTLYYQNRLRMIMAWRLLTYYLLHPGKYKDLFIIKSFRKFRENAQSTDKLYELTAKKTNVTKERAEKVIQKWIYDNPLDAVYKSRDRDLLSIINNLRNDGKMIAIWSDYRADDKLKALGMDCDNVYTAEDKKIGLLKPSPKGLDVIAKELNVPKEKILMVGDRPEKDAQAAKAAGTDFVILKKTKSKRKKQLLSLS